MGLKNLSKVQTIRAKDYESTIMWYQCKWHIAAGNIYDEGGLDAFEKLWLTLKEKKEILEDSSFADLLSEQVHQSVADVQLKWDQ